MKLSAEQLSILTLAMIVAIFVLLGAVPFFTLPMSQKAMVQLNAARVAGFFTTLRIAQ